MEYGGKDQTPVPRLRPYQTGNFYFPSLGTLSGRPENLFRKLITLLELYLERPLVTDPFTLLCPQIQDEEIYLIFLWEECSPP